MIDFNRSSKAIQSVLQETESATVKYASKNVTHNLPKWLSVIEKQVADLRAAVYSEGPTATRKELKQVAAAAILAMVHSGLIE